MSKTVFFGKDDFTDLALSRNLNGFVLLLQKTISLKFSSSPPLQRAANVEINTPWSWINCVPRENKHNKNDLRFFSFYLLICNLSWIGTEVLNKETKMTKMSNLTGTTASQPYCGALWPCIPK